MHIMPVLQLARSQASRTAKRAGLLLKEMMLAGEEDAEDSDDEINEDLDVDAAADAFAAAAREKGFGDGPQHPGDTCIPANALLV